MQDVSYGLREHVKALPAGMNDPELLKHVQNLESRVQARFTIVDSEGQVLVDSRTGYKDIGNHGSRPEIIEARQKGIGFQQRTSETLNLPLLYLAIPLYEPGESIPRFCIVNLCIESN